MDYSFPKDARILERGKFLKIMKAGTKVPGSSIVIFYRRKPVGLARLGITVSKKHGKAHDRNYFKRLVREAFRLCRTQLPSDIEINVQPAGKKGTYSANHLNRGRKAERQHTTPPKGSDTANHSIEIAKQDSATGIPSAALSLEKGIARIRAKEERCRSHSLSAIMDDLLHFSHKVRISCREKGD